MVRPIGRVVISFGLVNVPMKLFSSTTALSKISFNLMSPAGRRLKQQYIEPESGDIVEHRDQLKGYEFTKGQYVVFSQEEIKALGEPRSPNLIVEEFVPEDEVGSDGVEKTYFLSPDNSGEKGYELLRRAMLDAKKMGLGRHCTHGKQHLAGLRATEKGILLQHLFYVDELVQFSKVHSAPKVNLSPLEIKMAGQLIEMASTEKLDLKKYQDDVRARYEAAIKAKIEGREIQAPAVENERQTTIDLMEQLKKSLGYAA